MKFAVRWFFRCIRTILTPCMLAWETLSAPKAVSRTPARQQEIDEACRSLTLYQFRACPFCIKVRQQMRRLALNIDLRDARDNPEDRAALQQGGGRIKVPCLRINDNDGNPRWLYESSEIIRYLDQRFA